MFSGGGLDNFNDLGEIIQNVAIDGSGNVWTANDYGATVGKFNPLGVSLFGTNGSAPSGCGLSETSYASAVAINAASTQAWVGVSDKNAVCILTSAGAYVTETNIYASDGTGDGPYGIAFDSSGNAWVTNDNGAENAQAGQLVKVSGTSPYSVLATETGNGLDYPLGIAIEPAGADIWVGNYNYNGDGTNNYDSVFTETGATASFSPSDGGNANISYGDGVAIDSNGYVWTVVANDPGGVGKISSTGTGGTYYGQNAAYAPQSIAIDGGGNVWYNTNSR